MWKSYLANRVFIGETPLTILTYTAYNKKQPHRVNMRNKTKERKEIGEKNSVPRVAQSIDAISQIL